MLKKNVRWVIVWIGRGLALGLWVGAARGATSAAEYYAAYAIEESLSIDNMFVFLIFFSRLRLRLRAVPDESMQPADLQPNHER